MDGKAAILTANFERYQIGKTCLNQKEYRTGFRITRRIVPHYPLRQTQDRYQSLEPDANQVTSKRAPLVPRLEGGSRDVFLGLAPGSQPSVVLRLDSSVGRQQPRVQLVVRESFACSNMADVVVKRRVYPEYSCSPCILSVLHSGHSSYQNVRFNAVQCDVYLDNLSGWLSPAAETYRSGSEKSFGRERLIVRGERRRYSETFIDAIMPRLRGRMDSRRGRFFVLGGGKGGDGAGYNRYSCDTEVEKSGPSLPNGADNGAPCYLGAALHLSPARRRRVLRARIAMVSTVSGRLERRDACHSTPFHPNIQARSVPGNEPSRAFWCSVDGQALVAVRDVRTTTYCMGIISVVFLLRCAQRGCKFRGRPDKQNTCRGSSSSPGRLSCRDVHCDRVAGSAHLPARRPVTYGPSCRATHRARAPAYCRLLTLSLRRALVMSPCPGPYYGLHVQIAYTAILQRDSRDATKMETAHLVCTVQRHDGNTARLARRSDEALGARGADGIATTHCDKHCEEPVSEILSTGQQSGTSERVWSSAGVKGRGKREFHEKTPPTNGMVRHDSHKRKSGAIGDEYAKQRADIGQRHAGRFVFPHQASNERRSQRWVCPVVQLTTRTASGTMTFQRVQDGIYRVLASSIRYLSRRKMPTAGRNEWKVIIFDKKEEERSILRNLVGGVGQVGERRGDEANSNVSFTEAEEYTTCIEVDLKQGFQKSVILDSRLFVILWHANSTENSLSDDIINSFSVKINNCPFSPVPFLYKLLQYCMPILWGNIPHIGRMKKSYMDIGPKRFVSSLQPVIHNVRCMSRGLDHVTVECHRSCNYSPIPAPEEPCFISTRLDLHLWEHLKALLYATPVDHVHSLRNRICGGSRNNQEFSRDSSKHPGVQATCELSCTMVEDAATAFHSNMIQPAGHTLRGSDHLIGVVDEFSSVSCVTLRILFTCQALSTNEIIGSPLKVPHVHAAQREHCKSVHGGDGVLGCAWQCRPYRSRFSASNTKKKRKRQLQAITSECVYE
ncbi:hypothetical protein PR048_030543 [Dryococelus australis]|uniref:Uncharacterized protein n=1 Tax=Dryococelus australis TaxID=614101 RepID=A0ABQ9GA24_9NEOP|nr:hypothetical protein PR048_030543 [Dryococelus australis]